MRRDTLLAALFCLTAALCLSATSHASTYSDIVLGDSPLAYWRLGESSGTVAQDATSNNNDGTYVNSVQLGVTPGSIFGDPDSAVRIDGSDERVQANLASLGTSYTMELWFKNERSLTAGYITGYVISRGTAGGSGATADTLGIMGTYVPSKTPGTLYWGTSYITYSNTVIDNNRWYYVAMVREDASNVRMVIKYLDDSGQTVTDTMTSTIPATFGTGKDIFVGTRMDYGWDFKGLVDNVAIYNTALTDTQIDAHFAAVPEPMTMSLLGMGGLALLRRRR